LADAGRCAISTPPRVWGHVEGGLNVRAGPWPATCLDPSLPAVSYHQTVSRYWAFLPEQARGVFRRPLDVPVKELRQRDEYFYFVRAIDPYADDGFHTQLACGFVKWIGDQAIEFFAPRRAFLCGIPPFPRKVDQLCRRK
jgi:hypothetical protein